MMDKYRAFITPNEDGTEVEGTTIINTRYEKLEDVRNGLKEYREVINKQREFSVYGVAKKISSPQEPQKEYICMMTFIQ